MTPRPHHVGVHVEADRFLVGGKTWERWTVAELVALAWDMALLVPLGDPADREHLEKALRAIGHLRLKLAPDPESLARYRMAPPDEAAQIEHRLGCALVGIEPDPAKETS